MCPAGGGFEDLFICFQCIKAARLRPNDRILLMASLGGSVDFARVTQHLRQLFTQPAATKEDIFPVIEDLSGHPPEDLSYEAWVAYHQKRKSPTGGGNPSRSRSHKGKGKKTKTPKGGKERNGFNRRTGERNRCYGCGSEYHLLPKCPTKQEKRARYRCLPNRRRRGPPFPLLRWRIPRKMRTSWSIRSPPPCRKIDLFFMPTMTV